MTIAELREALLAVPCIICSHPLEDHPYAVEDAECDSCSCRFNRGRIAEDVLDGAIDDSFAQFIADTH